MDSPLGLLSLPEEVLQHLCKYLSLSDVLQCCETCSYLRSALNHNSVWKRFFPSTDISRLETQYQYVQPTFQFDFQSSLPTLCSARMLLMKKAHLLNNWRNNNFVCKSSKTDFPHFSGVFNQPKGRGKLIYEHHYIFTSRFINDIHSDAIEVWDVENEPVLHCALPMENLKYDSFFIVEKYLVVILCRKVNVYEINLHEKAFPIKYSFMVDEDFVSFNTNVHHGIHDMGCSGWSHSNVDQYLLSSKCLENPCAFHLWDISNAIKTGTFHSPVQGFSIRFHSKMGNAWLLLQRFENNNNTNYLPFDIKKKEFSNDYFKLRCHCNHVILHKNYVLVFKTADDANEDGWKDTICSLYDFNSSVKLKERRFKNARKSFKIESTVIVNGSFVLLHEGCFKLVDAISLEILESIECSPKLKFITSHYNIHGCLFVLASSSDYSLEMWDIKKRIKIPKFLKTVYSSHMYFDDLATKVVCFDYYNVIVAHFW